MKMMRIIMTPMQMFILNKNYCIILISESITYFFLLV